MFFDNILVNIDFEKGNDTRTDAYFYDQKDGNIIMMVRVVGKLKDICPRLESVFAHELTHAYEDSQMKDRGIKLGIMKNYNWLYGESINLLNRAGFIPSVIEAFAYCCYWLDSKEVNANLGSIEEELKEYMDKIFSERSAEKYIKMTKVYEKLENVKKAYNDIKGQSEFISKWFYDNYKDYKLTVREINGLIKKIGFDLIKFERKFNVNAAKLAYKYSIEKSNP